MIESQGPVRNLFVQIKRALGKQDHVPSQPIQIKRAPESQGHVLSHPIQINRALGSLVLAQHILQSRAQQNPENQDLARNQLTLINRAPENPVVQAVKIDRPTNANEYYQIALGLMWGRKKKHRLKEAN